ncbi:MAG: YihA family ribosome biogenesis GTP-binding protein [Eubacteriaceae bacterium]|nr:YihA family ribosome biogenesis GTP-binding protein [Eubacteriaceae bacterium]
MLKVKSAGLVTSAPSAGSFPPPEHFEIVLVGKSNVGKSSFINAVLGRKSLARTSSEPGKTRTANFYLINDSFYLVDMPGYGYAKTSRKIRESFGPLIESYLEKRNADFAVIHLVDYRHPPTSDDIRMHELIRSYGVSPVTVLTKEDKLKRNERAKMYGIITSQLGIDEDEAVLEFSTQKKELIEEMQNFLGELICSI